MANKALAILAGVVTLSLVSCSQKQDAAAPAPPSAPPPQIQTTVPESKSEQTLPTVELHIDHATLQTEIAATEPERERGLMFRTRLGDNDGMIFLMGNIAPATFWMKNTLIPLSVAYIDKNGVILEIHDMEPAPADLPDNKIPVTRSDSDEVAYALETNVHWFALNGIKPGDKIDPPPATLGNPNSP